MCQVHLTQEQPKTLGKSASCSAHSLTRSRGWSRSPAWIKCSHHFCALAYWAKYAKIARHRKETTSIRYTRQFHPGSLQNKWRRLQVTILSSGRRSEAMARSCSMRVTQAVKSSTLAAVSLEGRKLSRTSYLIATKRKSRSILPREVVAPSTPSTWSCRFTIAKS